MKRQKDPSGPSAGAKTGGMPYPAFSLKTALERVESIRDGEGRNSLTLRALAVRWNRSETSSGFHHDLRTLSGYGLVEIRGMFKDPRTVCALTARALRLLSGDGSGRAKLLREAALSQPLYRDLWERHGVNLPPAKVLAARMIEENYRPLYVASMIESWRETMAFAGLDREGAEPATVAEYSAPEEEAEAEPEPEEEEPAAMPPPRAAQPGSAAVTAQPARASAPPASPAVASERHLLIPLLCGDVPVPLGMAESEYHLLLHTLKVLKGRIVAV